TGEPTCPEHIRLAKRAAAAIPVHVAPNDSDFEPETNTEEDAGDFGRRVDRAWRDDKDCVGERAKEQVGWKEVVDLVLTGVAGRFGEVGVDGLAGRFGEGRRRAEDDGEDGDREDEARRKRRRSTATSTSSSSAPTTNKKVAAFSIKSRLGVNGVVHGTPILATLASCQSQAAAMRNALKEAAANDDTSTLTAFMASQAMRDDKREEDRLWREERREEERIRREEMMED
ncbi:hypothetical protein HK101_006142, partial [Irineochytrium annulatum]